MRCCYPQDLQPLRRRLQAVRACVASSSQRHRPVASPDRTASRGYVWLRTCGCVRRVDEFIEKHLLPRVKQLKPRRIRMRKGSVALTPVTPKSSRSRKASMDEVATEVIRTHLADRDRRGESEGKGEEAGAASGATVGSVAGSPA